MLRYAIFQAPERGDLQVGATDCPREAERIARACQTRRVIDRRTGDWAWSVTDRLPG